MVQMIFIKCDKGMLNFFSWMDGFSRGRNTGHMRKPQAAPSEEATWRAAINLACEYVVYQVQIGEEYLAIGSSPAFAFVHVLAYRKLILESTGL